MKIYLAGSLRNPRIMDYLQELQNKTSWEVFADWYAVGPDADDHWRDFWQQQGVPYKEALTKPNSRNIFEFDKKYIDASDVLVLAYPAGKSGHLELGYHLGKGKPGFILLDDDPERFDVMAQFATGIADDVDELIELIKGLENESSNEFLDGLPVGNHLTSAPTSGAVVVPTTCGSHFQHLPGERGEAVNGQWWEVFWHTHR